MEKAVYLGLTEKVAKRIGISKVAWEQGKQKEIKRIVDSYLQFESGKPVNWIVKPERMADRLDVKHCLDDKGRKRNL